MRSGLWGVVNEQVVALCDGVAAAAAAAVVDVY
jgi:hypothetical protein